MLDVNKPLADKRVIERELEGFGIRINKEPPNIVFKKKDKGGIAITSTVPLTHIDHDVRDLYWVRCLSKPSTYLYICLCL